MYELLVLNYLIFYEICSIVYCCIVLREWPHSCFCGKTSCLLFGIKFSEDWRALSLIYKYPNLAIHWQRLWQAKWDRCTFSILHNKQALSRYCNLSHLNHQDAVMLRRLRIGHTYLTHLYLLYQEPPQCLSCNWELTVVHVLLECWQYK